MDDSTKKYAQKKIDQISFKIGYPEWMANQAEVCVINSAIDWLMGLFMLFIEFSNDWRIDI